MKPTPRAVPVIALFLLLLVPAAAFGQEEVSASQRKAAAEAYDRGTADYLAGEYGRAAQWFETAHRMAPAAPALMQAIRAHLKADNRAEAATLALRLRQDYRDVDQAVAYADKTLEEIAPDYFRVDVVCDANCKIDLDGKILETQSFFLEPDTEHSVIASFSTGDVREEVRGGAGETQTLELAAPPEPVRPPDEVEPVGPGTGTIDLGTKVDSDGKLDPLYTYIGAGVTGALLIAGVVTYTALSGKNGDYEAAAKKASAEIERCGNCDEAQTAYKDAEDKQQAALDAESLNNAMWIGTGVVAVGTGVLAAFFTDWGGDDGDDSEAELTFRVERVQDGAFVSLGGRF